MPGSEQVKRALASVPRSPDKLSGKTMALQANETGTDSVVASLKAERPIALREVSYDVDLPAYESFTSDGTGGNTETFNLNYDAVDSDTIANDVLVYVTGTGYVEPDAVDYAADTVDVTDPGTDNAVHVWYFSADQATMRVRKVAPSNTWEDVDEDDMGLRNLRDQLADPLEFDFDHPFQGVVPTDWDLEVRIDAPYPISWSEEGGDATPTNARISLPIYRARDEIPGLGRFIAQKAATR
ncbi:VP4/VP17-like Major capsid protein [Halanaeroarchaeum sp. HSR-CO]|uniref:hypothetical protein n=1 Tax=Halanaeroarchaeum sp. HSR-CO TaxID=2866382 RepID=UPI00217CEDB9|nr:hypothetical protein [Halanaeroarchaeum sp. HSR-CO]UWG46579.1 VP4/VP17-like Major capsid protein [Halanaeroarchaeum sp. HSR-CO]